MGGVVPRHSPRPPGLCAPGSRPPPEGPLGLWASASVRWFCIRTPDSQSPCSVHKPLSLDRDSPSQRPGLKAPANPKEATQCAALISGV